MIKHEISAVSLSSQAAPASYFMTRSIEPQGHAHQPDAAAATSYHAPAVSALFLIAALTVLAAELIERFGGRVEALVCNEEGGQRFRSSGAP